VLLLQATEGELPESVVEGLAFARELVCQHLGELYLH